MGHSIRLAWKLMGDLWVDAAAGVQKLKYSAASRTDGGGGFPAGAARASACSWFPTGPAGTWRYVSVIMRFKNSLWNHLGDSCLLLQQSLSVWSYLIQECFVDCLGKGTPEPDEQEVYTLSQPLSGWGPIMASPTHSKGSAFRWRDVGVWRRKEECDLTCVTQDQATEAKQASQLYSRVAMLQTYIQIKESLTMQLGRVCF